MLTKFLGSIWVMVKIPKGWCESVILPICHDNDGSSCGTHRGISLIRIASKLHAGVIPHWLSGARERCVREDEVGFRPGRVVLTNFSVCVKS